MATQETVAPEEEGGGEGWRGEKGRERGKEGGKEGGSEGGEEGYMYCMQDCAQALGLLQVASHTYTLRVRVCTHSMTVCMCVHVLYMNSHLHSTICRVAYERRKKQKKTDTHNLCSCAAASMA